MSLFIKIKHMYVLFVISNLEEKATTIDICQQITLRIKSTFARNVVKVLRDLMCSQCIVKFALEILYDSC